MQPPERRHRRLLGKLPGMCTNGTGLGRDERPFQMNAENARAPGSGRRVQEQQTVRMLLQDCRRQPIA